MEVFLMLTQQYGILVALLVLFGWGMIVFTYKYARLISTCEALKEVIANVKKDVFEHIKDGGAYQKETGEAIAEIRENIAAIRVIIQRSGDRF